MLKTLHFYIAKDIAKIFAAVFIVLTLLLSTIFIIEPLRKQGLAGSEALYLFALAVPMMATITLPFAALFAATFVYGRFSQDNELLASKASGIGVVTILKPAMTLGIFVMVFSMFLSNFVSPRLANITQKFIEANMRGVITNQIKSNGYFKLSSFMLTADPSTIESGTDEYGQYLKLTNVVAVDSRKADDVNVATATEAVIRFKMFDERNECFITAVPVKGYRFSTGRDLLKNAKPTDYKVAGVCSTGPRFFQCENLLFQSPALQIKSAGEKPSFFDWPRLLSTLREPQKHPEINREMSKIADEIRRNSVLSDIALQVCSAGKKGVTFNHTTPRRTTEKLTLQADTVEEVKDGAINLSNSSDDGKVKLTVREGARLVEYEADTCRLWSDYSEMLGQSYITIKMAGNVRRTEDGKLKRPGDLSWGEISLLEQQHLSLTTTASMTLGELYRNPARYTSNATLLDRVKSIKVYRVLKIERKILAEIHSRLALGISCFLMVTFGAALGVIFRGGEFVSALLLSAIPALLTFLGISVLGKQMITNEEVEVWKGTVAVWGSVILLISANIGIYWHLSRK